MKDTDTPNRSSNMEKAEGDRDEDARDQEQMIERPERGAPKSPERNRMQQDSGDEPTLRTDM